MSQKIYLYILRGGVYLSFLTIFFVFNGLLFPFITSKQIPFNILMEILFVFWLAFIIKYPSRRPQKSWLSIGLIAFFAALLLSCFTSVDFNLSFWGDIERMLGVFHLLHFLVFYFIIITVFRDWSDWRNLLVVSLAAAFVETFYVIYKISYGTLGNTSYISGYMIFNIYFALLLFFRHKNWWLKALYLLPIPFMLYAMKIAGTRGAYVGMGISILLFFFLLAVLGKNKKIKYSSILAALLFVVFIFSVYANRDSLLVQNNLFLKRITDINFQTATFQTRLISWKTAYKDFPAHPFFGTGYGNFAITFDKYFDPIFYNYTASETYFDHAHNNLVDIASTTGLIGIVAYLSIFIAAGFYLIKGYRVGKIKAIEFILLVCLIAAYFIQNIVLFDSFVTYLSLMIMLGFIYWLNQEEKEEAAADEQLSSREYSVLLFAGLVFLLIIYQYNIKPLKMLSGTIDGQIAAARQGDIVVATEIYKKALSYNTILDRDSRASFVRLALQQSNQLAELDREKRNEILDYAILLAKKNIEYNPKDSFNQMTLAQILNLAAGYNMDSAEKFFYYSNQAEEAVNKSIEASPGRQPLYFTKAQLYLTRGNKDSAIETLEYAVGLNPDYPDAQCQLARVLFFAEQTDKGYAAMGKCIDLGGAQTLNSVQQLSQLKDYYSEAKDYERLIKVLKRVSELLPQEAKVRVDLANIYSQIGEKDLAIEAARQAVELDPSIKAGAEDFIRKIEGK